MASENELRRALRSLTRGDQDSAKNFICTVKEVNSDFTITAEPITGEPEILNVRLSVDNSKNFQVIPKANSIVYVVMLTETFGFVSMYSEIENIYLGGDKYGGLIKIDDLVNKLNNLEEKVNNLNTTFATHTHAGVTVGQGATAVPSSPPINQLTPTQKVEIENTVIQHGGG